MPYFLKGRGYVLFFSQKKKTFPFCDFVLHPLMILLSTGFTMYTTCVIWLAFVPLYFGTSSHVPLRITSMSVTISLSASVTLACLFSPKVSLHDPRKDSFRSFKSLPYNNGDVE